jgi:hypothetical protein
MGFGTRGIRDAVSESNQDMGRGVGLWVQFSSLLAYTSGMNWKLVFLPGLLCVAVASCSGDDSVAGGPAALTPLDIPAQGVLGSAASLDLVVISIDTLRADRLPFYGAEHATAGDPGAQWSLAWMAQQGTLFDQVWAPAGMTLPSFGTLWTGLSPLEHGAMGNHRQVVAPTFAMELAALGWNNHAVVANQVLNRGSGVDRGFSSYEVRAKEQEANGPALLLLSTERGIQERKRSLIWAHYMAPHQPYEPNPIHLGKFSAPDGVPGDRNTLEGIHSNPDRSAVDEKLLAHLRGLYDEEILTANDYVMTFLSGLDAQYQAAGRGGLLENAVVLLVSDHGEELAFHENYFMHAKSIYSGTTHVPLVILGGDWKPGQRIRRALPLAAVLPMVLRGTQPQAQVFFSAWRDVYFAARDERWTLIHNPSNNRKGPQEPPQGVPFAYPQVALFDRLVDPLELHDVAAEHPEITRHLLDALHHWYFQLNRDAGSGAVVLTPERQTELAELGYATGDDPDAVNLALPWPGTQWNP